MQIFSNVVTILAGIAAIIYLILQIKSKDTISKIHSPTVVLNQQYIYNQIYVNETAQNKQNKFFPYISNHIPQSSWEWGFFILLLACFLYIRFYHYYKILLIITILIAIALICYIFIKAHAAFCDRFLQIFSFTMLLIFMFLSLVSTIIAKAPPRISDLTTETLPETAYIGAAFFFILLLLMKLIANIILNFRNDHFLWLNFRKYSIYSFFGIFIYLSATNTFISTFQSIFDAIYDFLFANL